jgi:hypothetical protein
MFAGLATGLLWACSEDGQSLDGSLILDAGGDGGVVDLGGADLGARDLGAADLGRR